MDAIALGCLAALIADRKRFPVRTLGAFAMAGTSLLIFCLGFSIESQRLGLDRIGLDMTIVAAGTCLIAVAAAQSGHVAPHFTAPLLLLGRRSYEIYLTHMFVVFALFQLFLDSGKPIGAVPALFLISILISGLLGETIARFYSEPLNQRLRGRQATSDRGAIISPRQA